MRMGNYFRGCAVLPSVMAASHSQFGVRHVTVVPTNFQTADSDDEDAAASESSR